MLFTLFDSYLELQLNRIDLLTSILKSFYSILQNKGEIKVVGKRVILEW